MTSGGPLKFTGKAADSQAETKDTLVRYPIAAENADDLIADLAQAVKQIWKDALDG